MSRWRRVERHVPAHATGAGLLAGAAALVAALCYLAALWLLRPTRTAPFSTDLYLIGYTGFVFYATLAAPLAGFAIGRSLWRRRLSSASAPRRGAIAGAVTAFGTVLAVPVSFGLLFAVRELAGATPAVFRDPVTAFAVLARGGLVHWSLPVGAALVPLCALAGWLYQRR